MSRWDQDRETDVARASLQSLLSHASEACSRKGRQHILQVDYSVIISLVKAFLGLSKKESFTFVSELLEQALDILFEQLKRSKGLLFIFFPAGQGPKPVAVNEEAQRYKGMTTCKRQLSGPLAHTINALADL